MTYQNCVQTKHVFLGGEEENPL